MIYMLLKSKFISESDSGIKSEFQCQINHGPEWNVEFSIPHKRLTNIYLIFEPWRRVILPNKIFSPKLDFQK